MSGLTAFSASINSRSRTGEISPSVEFPTLEKERLNRFKEPAGEESGLYDRLTDRIFATSILPIEINQSLIHNFPSATIYRIPVKMNRIKRKVTPIVIRPGIS
jgi:hypothetical protein